MYVFSNWQLFRCSKSFLLLCNPDAHIAAINAPLCGSLGPFHVSNGFHEIRWNIFLQLTPSSPKWFLFMRFLTDVSFVLPCSMFHKCHRYWFSHCSSIRHFQTELNTHLDRLEPKQLPGQLWKCRPRGRRGFGWPRIRWISSPKQVERPNLWTWWWWILS